MSTFTQSLPTFGSAPRAGPTAALEVLSYLGVVGVGTLCFLMGWLGPDGAIVLTVLLLTSLIVLSWVRLDRGRHPCFLFLCMLMLFQGGRLIAYCLGAEPQPMRVVLMGTNFDLPRDEQGLALLCVSLAAICIYVPSRWMFRYVAPPDTRPVQKYLPYLWLLFFLSMPVQLFKNYRYFQYAQEHGGYLSIFLTHEAIASTVPFVVRVIPLVAFPAFVAIFVFEQRKFPRYLATILYFASASLILALGARGNVISLILVLWWVARVKSQKRSRIVLLAIFVMALIFIGDAVRQSRENIEENSVRFSALDAVSIEGAPLNMTEMAIKYRSYFSPYSGSYMLRELQNGFVAGDRATYYRGEALDFDASVLLSPRFFSLGGSVASSYIGEAYVAGSVPAVILVSLGIGFGLAAVYKYSSNAPLMFFFAMGLPQIILMPRSQLLDWLSVFMRNTISIALLVAGWKIYALVTSIRQAAALPDTQLTAGPVT